MVVPVVSVVDRKARLVIEIGNPEGRSRPSTHFGGLWNMSDSPLRFSGSGVHREVSSFSIVREWLVTRRHGGGCSWHAGPDRLGWV